MKNFLLAESFYLFLNDVFPYIYNLNILSNTVTHRSNIL